MFLKQFFDEEKPGDRKKGQDENKQYVKHWILLKQQIIISFWNIQP
jgi:hypothetical protein